MRSTSTVLYYGVRFSSDALLSTKRANLIDYVEKRKIEGIECKLDSYDGCYLLSTDSSRKIKSGLSAEDFLEEVNEFRGSLVSVHNEFNKLFAMFNVPLKLNVYSFEA